MKVLYIQHAVFFIVFLAYTSFTILNGMEEAEERILNAPNDGMFLFYNEKQGSWKIAQQLTEEDSIPSNLLVLNFSYITFVEENYELQQKKNYLKLNEIINVFNSETSDTAVDIDVSPLVYRYREVIQDLKQQLEQAHSSIDILKLFMYEKETVIKEVLSALDALQSAKKNDQCILLPKSIKSFCSHYSDIVSALAAGTVLTVGGIACYCLSDKISLCFDIRKK